MPDRICKCACVHSVVLNLLWRLRLAERAHGDQVPVLDQRRTQNVLQHLRLRWLERHEATENMQKVEQVAGVFGEPVVGLDVAERGRRPAIADDRTAS